MKEYTWGWIFFPKIRRLMGFIYDLWVFLEDFGTCDGTFDIRSRQGFHRNTGQVASCQHEDHVAFPRWITPWIHLKYWEPLR